MSLRHRMLGERHARSRSGLCRARSQPAVAGRGIEVHDIRLWLDGDDVRHIDANATARTGHLHVRTFHDDPESPALLFADFRPSMLFGTKRTFKSVAAAEALALTGWSLIAAGRRVGLFAVGPDATTSVSHRSSERGMAAVIGGLVDSHAKALESAKTDDDPLDACLEMAARHLAPGGALIIASGLDEPGPSFESFMTSWARRACLQVILVSDAFEHERPRGWYPFATGSTRPEWGRFDLKTPAVTDDRLMLLEKCGVSAVRLDVEQDPESMIPELEALDVEWT